ncbi:hypothetical protein [Streptomyces sp. NPDC092307]|uniref:hypothetical protein n=1 Tax=Streptomyces sp. NPDC092307 TaxID=3366013 RepID=UPI003829E27B
MPVIFFSGREPLLPHTQVDWGWGSVSDAMRCAVGHYQESRATDPAFVAPQVGDEPYDEAEVRSLPQNTASHGICRLFVGFGRGKLACSKDRNASASATFTYVAFCDAGKRPGATPGKRFYTGMVDAFARWMRSCCRGCSPAYPVREDVPGPGRGDGRVPDGGEGGRRLQKRRHCRAGSRPRCELAV